LEFGIVDVDEMIGKNLMRCGIEVGMSARVLEPTAMGTGLRSHLGTEEALVKVVLVVRGTVLRCKQR
jgi:hypothetical protein